MPDLVIQFLKDVNIAQLLAIGIMIWFFYSRLDKKIEKIHTELKSDINNLNNKVDDIDRRLCRIDGSLATQGHCLFSQAPQEKKCAISLTTYLLTPILEFMPLGSYVSFARTNCGHL